MDWFTADLHKRHNKMLEERNFHSIEAHDQHIVNVINNYVRPQDTLYILGDMSFDKPAATADWLAQMNCRKVLVKGNHDHRTKNAQGAMLPQPVMLELSEFHHYLERKFEIFVRDETDDGEFYKPLMQNIVMSHFPLAHWHGQHKGTWHLHGHMHGNPPGVAGKIMDVGWDAWGAPVSLAGVAQYMRTKPVRASHHDPVIDYERLLKWYLRHVGECEGVDFTDSIGSPWGNTAPLTAAEAAALMRLSKEAWD